ncbi:MAG: hypothetical protein QXO72_03015 [Sulfolobales archaeon]
MDALIALASFGAPLGVAGDVLGSTAGISRAAPAGLSVLAEEPEQFKYVLLLSTLPMTQTFYGFIFTFYTLMIVLPATQLTQFKALAIVGVGLMVFVAETFSAYFQGVVCMQGILELPKTKGKILTSSLILAAYEELFGILGMVFGLILVLMSSGLPI